MARFTSKRNSSPIKNMIRESLEELKHGSNEFPDDPSLDADEITGPERFAKGQKHKDEVVIDGLLADVSGKAGYFLKLKKEIRPNEWMLMKVIENEWRRWADIESAVADIVREHTKKSPAKWGTGAYRVEIACKGGMRGKGYDPIDYFINAEEEFVAVAANGQPIPVSVDPNVAVASKLEELSTLVNLVGNLVPKPQDPAKTQEQIASAFQQGMAIKSNDGNSQTQMMTALMTGLIGMMTTMMTSKSSGDVSARVVNPHEDMKGMLETLKTFGVLGGGHEKQKTLTDTLTELKLLGVDIFKKEDPLDQVTKLKQIASIASDFMGMGSGNADRPSILEKIVDAVAPAIPGIVKDIKETANNAVRVQELASQNMERAKQLGGSTQQIPQQESTTFQQMNGAQSGEVPMNNQVPNDQVKQFFNNLHESVKTNNRMFYPIVYTSLIQDAKGQELLQGILQGTHGADQLVSLLQQYGDVRFKDSEFVLKYLVGYVNGFIAWTRQMMGGQTVSSTPAESNGRVKREFDVECPSCKTIFSFGSEQEFVNDENKNCGVDLGNGTFCQGVLQPLVKA